MGTIETDYLVIGAGASGMAFTDALIAESDADVVMADRRHRPAGHWNDAYPFVRLHQPSACYGVNSRQLGNDTIDQTGPNSGYYERATAAEICDYYQRALEENLLPSGQVRFFGLHDYTGEVGGEHRIVSRLTGEEQTIRVRRKVVDATYLETSAPATHTPPFDVDPEAWFIPPNDLVDLDQPPTGYTVLGAGKTGMDTCCWLLDNGVDPDDIRWIKPRETWLIDRGSLQPLELVTSIMEWFSLNVEAAAQAQGVDDLFSRLEELEVLVRVDPAVEPTMYRLAIVSQRERNMLRQIENIVRKGRVRHIGTSEIVLEQGSIPTDKGQVHIDCTASGLRPRPARPIFEPGMVRIQPIRMGQTAFNAGFIGYVEASRERDEDKNQLSPPNPYPNQALDWISTTYVSLAAAAAWSQQPDIQAWLEGSRLNLIRGAGDHMHDPRMEQAASRFMANLEPGLANLKRLMAETHPAAAKSPLSE